MDISYYETKDIGSRRKRLIKIWNICKMIIAIGLLIFVMYGGSQYLMQELI